MVLKKQIEQICTELEIKNKTIEDLEAKNAKLQETQLKIM